MVDSERPRTTDQLMRDKSAWTFARELPSFHEALRFFKKSPEVFQARVDEFDEIITKMNGFLALPDCDEHNYQHLISLKNRLEGQPIKPLNQLAEENSQTVSEIVDSTFADIKERVVGGDWDYATELEPGQLASAMLIEGYGLMLARQYGGETTAKDFVYGFEEVLLLNHEKDSPLLDDVLEWMVEEREDFSPGVQTTLNDLAEVET